MFSPRPRSSIVQAAALCLAFACPVGPAGASDAAPNAAETAPLEAVMARIADWVVAHSSLTAPDAMPQLVRLPERTLAELHHGPDAATLDVEALYDTERQTILVSEGWTDASPESLSVLVHEMVHHLQSLAGRSHACPGEREAEAYAVQARWLEAHGSSLEAAFGIDPLTLLVRTACIF